MLFKVVIGSRWAVLVLNYLSVQRQHFPQVSDGSIGVIHHWAGQGVWGWRSHIRVQVLCSAVLPFLGSPPVLC